MEQSICSDKYFYELCIPFRYCELQLLLEYCLEVEK